MTLREWVEAAAGRFGTRAELEAFETNLLETEARWREDGSCRRPAVSLLELNLAQETWELSFAWTLMMSRRLKLPRDGGPR